MDVNIFIVSLRLGSFLLSHLDLDSNTRKRRLSTVCVRACVRVCVCVTMKKVPDEWQARQAIPAILQVAASTTQRNQE